MKYNNQKKINEVCKHRGIPKIKKGSRCTVRFKDAHVVGGNSSGNLQVKFVESGDEFSCDPYWKMTVFNNDGSVFYNSEEYTMEERVIDRWIGTSQGAYDKLIGSVPKLKQSDLASIAPVCTEQAIDKEENGRRLICWILLAFALFASSGLIFIFSKVME